MCIRDRAGIELRRFKTGTPARVNKRSIDFTDLEVQNGDENPVPMSFMTRGKVKNTLDVYKRQGQCRGLDAVFALSV